MKAKQWFNLHAWAGLLVGSLLLITCLSGTLATLSHEIEYLSDSKFRALSHSPNTDFAAIENTLAQRYPGSQIISILRHQQQWWRHFLKKPRQLKTTNRSSWADWHKLLGLWSYWFIVVMAITGVWYLVEHTLQTAKIDHYITPPAEVTDLQTDVAHPPAISAMVNAAQSAFPSLHIRAIQYPSKANKPVLVLGDNDDILVRLRANKVYLDPASADVLAIQKAADLPIVARIKDTADPLHFGNFAGLGTKLIWAVFGCLMTCICMAGLYMNWLRVKRKQPSLLQWFGIMGAVSVLLVCCSLLLTTQTFSVRQAPAKLYSPVL